jgi:hypothetical protein
MISAKPSKNSSAGEILWPHTLSFHKGCFTTDLCRNIVAKSWYTSVDGTVYCISANNQGLQVKNTLHKKSGPFRPFLETFAKNLAVDFSGR